MMDLNSFSRAIKKRLPGGVNINRENKSGIWDG